MKQDLREKKRTLEKKLERLEEAYPNDDIYSLDRWDGSGFPEKLQVTVCGLPEVEGAEDPEYEEDCTYCHLDPGAFEKRNKVLKQKYGFEVDYYDGHLYYNADLRSISGFVFEEYDGCLDLVVKTGKYGISPVGYQAEKVRKLIEDAEVLKF
jgi:hypothetical protein